MIVVTGAGHAFCAGTGIEMRSASSAERRLSRPRRPVTLVRSIPKPVIAAINGVCAGIGFVQACAADLRFASTTATLTTSFGDHGVPADNSVSWLLPRLVGTGVARDLLVSERRVLLAAEAEAIGLVDRIYEPEELLPATMTYAADLAVDCAPWPMPVTKALVRVSERVSREPR